MLTLTCGDVVLTLATADDDDTLAALMPSDFDHDPTFAREPGTSLEEHRERWLRHWLAELRTPSKKDRTVAFLVSVDGDPVGLQTLEGADFDRERSFDSTSFLTPSARGRRLGVAMRHAIAALAFDQLGAQKLTSAATPHNVASRRVSERVGYRWVERRSPIVAGAPRPIDCFELTREDWLAQDRPSVQIDGVVPWIAAAHRRRQLARQLAGFDAAQVWENGAGGLTFDVGDLRFVKVGPSFDADPEAEAARLEWAGRWLIVPRVVKWGRDGDDVWSLTQGIPGRAAHEEPFRADPAATAHELGRALRHLHDILPVGECPWEWSVEARLSRLTASAREELGTPPTVDAVVCHGDACTPNFLLDDDGRWCGTIDVGNLGVADRYADIVDALFSIDRNFGTIRRVDFLRGYGLDVDGRRLTFYTKLWHAER